MGWDKTRAMDEFFIRFGMRESARETLAEFEKDPATIAMIDAFVDGINTWIREGHPLPPEYKILGVKPELFDRLRVIYMDKSLTFSLASRQMDLPLTALKVNWGR